MNALLILCDSAQTDPTGKVHALGMGWTVTSTPTPPAALLVFIRVPWTAANTRHSLLIELLNADGQTVPSPENSNLPVKVEGQFEAGRPPGVPPGMTLEQSITIPLRAGFDLKPGEVYNWRLEIDGLHEESWAVSFLVRSDGLSEPNQRA